MKSQAIQPEIEETEEVSLGDLFYKFIAYWPYFILLLVLTMTGAWIYLRYKMPVYQTTATLLIKDDKNATPASELANAFDMFGAKKNVENEVEVLESKTLMKEVVENLHLYAPVYVAGRVINQSGYVLSPIVVEAKYPDSLREVSDVPFTFNAQMSNVIIHDTAFALNQWVETSYGMLRFLPNPYYHPSDNKTNEKPSKYYFSLIPVKNAANQILSQVTIAPSSKESTVIDLSINDEIPKRGEDILNELLKVYNEAAILDKNQLAANTLKFVNERLAIVSNDLDSVESALQNFKTKNNITDISAQGHIYLQTVAANDQQISNINVQLAMLDQVEKYIEQKGELGGIAPAGIGNAGTGDPVLADLLQKLSALELQYTQTKKIVPENNPDVIAIVDGINRLRPQVLEHIESQRKNLLAGRDKLMANSNSYGSMLSTIPEKEKELLNITRQQEIKSNIYTFLLQKKEETTLSFASAVADSRVLDHAETSDIPVSPKHKLIYFGAIITALLLGMAILYFRDMLTRTIQQRSDIEKYTEIPFLGEVNYDRSNSPFVIAAGKRSFIAEQFRQLRTSLGYMGIDEGHKKILLTSSISGEGKSFISINLGISFALMGKRVALLEFDLRKPKLSDQFRIVRKEGLSNYLIGKVRADEIIKQTEFENLYLIPAGPIPPNPSELISNGRLVELLKYLENSFDYIIIDTAPVNPVTDAYIISPLADVTLFVIRQDYTPKIFLQKMEQQHKISTLKNPALIYNGIRGKGINKYGYGYGYGYTEESGNKAWWKSIFKS